MDRVRVDKWLWSVRIFKSRSISTTACKAGRIKLGDQTLKPSSLIETGYTLTVRKDGFNLIFKVVKLIDKRVSAPIARECYENLTPESELNKYKDWFIGKGAAEKRLPGVGRPTKKERRVIDDFKDHYYEFWDDEEN